MKVTWSQPGKCLLVYLKSEILNGANVVYMFAGLDSRFFRAFYVSKAEKEDEPSLNQDRESAVYPPSVPAQSARCWKIEVLCSRSYDSVSANTVLINACYGIFTRWSMSNRKVVIPVM